MWPYNEDEAGWLTPPVRPDRRRDASANDNDRERRAPARLAATPPDPAPRKVERET